MTVFNGLIFRDPSRPIKSLIRFDPTKSNHRLHGSSSTIVTTTSELSRKMENMIPCRPKTPKNIETKIGRNDYVLTSFYLASFVEIGPTRSSPIQLKYNLLVSLCTLRSLSSLFFLSLPTVKSLHRFSRCIHKTTRIHSSS